MSIHHIFLYLLLVLCMLPTSAAAADCTFTNISLISSVTVAPCAETSMINAAIVGATITINVGASLQALPSSANLLVTVKDVMASEGAVLVFLGLNCSSV